MNEPEVKNRIVSPTLDGVLMSCGGSLVLNNCGTRMYLGHMQSGKWSQVWGQWSEVILWRCLMLSSFFVCDSSGKRYCIFLDIEAANIKTLQEEIQVVIDEWDFLLTHSQEPQAVLPNEMTKELKKSAVFLLFYWIALSVTLSQGSRPQQPYGTQNIQTHTEADRYD